MRVVKHTVACCESNYGGLVLPAVLCSHICRMAHVTALVCTISGQMAMSVSLGRPAIGPARLLSSNLLRCAVTVSLHRHPSCGGLVLISGDGRIMCNNTLDDRLKIAYQANLPTVRAKLFGTMATGQH